MSTHSNKPLSTYPQSVNVLTRICPSHHCLTACLSATCVYLAWGTLNIMSHFSPMSLTHAVLPCVHQSIMPSIFPISIHSPQPGSCGIAQGKTHFSFYTSMISTFYTSVFWDTTFWLLMLFFIAFSPIVMILIKTILSWFVLLDIEFLMFFCVFLRCNLQIAFNPVLHTWPSSFSSSSLAGRVQRVAKFLAVSNRGQAQSSPPVKCDRAVPLESWAVGVPGPSVTPFIFMIPARIPAHTNK